MLDTTARKRTFAADIAGLDEFSPALEVVHHVPGRLRLRSGAIKDNDHACERARRKLAEIEGITSVTANSCTGSLLLQYDIAAVPPCNIAAVLASHGITTRLLVEGNASSSTGLDPEVIGALKTWVANALAERLAFAVFGALV
jgi:hypothetical protein